MTNNVGWTLKQAADLLNVSEMTVRRRVKAGKIPGKQIPGKYGDEWLITELPGAVGMNSSEPGEDNPFPNSEKGIDLLAMIKDLQQENRDLALALGEARANVLLLQEAKKPWYKRLFK